LTIGNPGNDPDTHGDGYGAVGHKYRISQFEVTAGDWRSFLNPVDPSGANALGLYIGSMDSSSYGCQVTWNAGSSTYDFSGAPEALCQVRLWSLFLLPCSADERSER
jgi:hypothetical protein